MNTGNRILVAYHSRSGHTAKVANDLALRLDADIEVIHDIQHGNGWLTTLRAGLNAWRQKSARIEALQHDPAHYSLTVIGSPVWAWQMAPAVRTYLQQTRGRLHQVAFFVTSGDTDVAKLSPTMEALANCKAVATTGFSERELKDTALYNHKLAAFVEAIKRAAVAE